MPDVEDQEATRSYAARQPEAGPRPQTTMRLNGHLLRALEQEAEALGWSRNFLAEQVLLSYVRSRGHKQVNLRLLLR